MKEEIQNPSPSVNQGEVQNPSPSMNQGEDHYGRGGGGDEKEGRGGGDDEKEGGEEEEEDNNECRTPKSDEHKIPIIRSCPPAPKKQRPVLLSCKRKMPDDDDDDDLNFFEITGREEIESFFRSCSSFNVKKQPALAVPIPTQQTHSG